jgi:hypothetical protein
VLESRFTGLYVEHQIASYKPPGITGIKQHSSAHRPWHVAAQKIAHRD